MADPREAWIFERLNKAIEAAAHEYWSRPSQDNSVGLGALIDDAPTSPWWDRRQVIWSATMRRLFPEAR